MQDGEVVDYTWTRVKTNKNYLKVKQTIQDMISNLQFCLQLRGAKLEDTGVFYCRGVNGFGSVRVRVELIITGDYSLVLTNSQITLYSFCFRLN